MTLTVRIRALTRCIVRVVGLGFREAEDRSSIQLESLFIVQVWATNAVGHSSLICVFTVTPAIGLQHLCAVRWGIAAAKQSILCLLLSRGLPCAARYDSKIIADLAALSLSCMPLPVQCLMSHHVCLQELCLGGSLRDKVLKQMTMWNKARLLRAL